MDTIISARPDPCIACLTEARSRRAFIFAEWRQNGIHLYGAVITGPVKELLTLREVSWVQDLRVGEVRLWNWNE